MPTPLSRKFVVIVTLMCSTHACDVYAKLGCSSVGKVSYRIGTEYQYSGISIRGDGQPGQSVASGQGVRSGSTVVFQCLKGVVTFDHEWVPLFPGAVRPLTIGGSPSGLGLRASVKRGGSLHFSYPGQTQQSLESIWIPIPSITTPVDVASESVHYDIVRTSGPLRFGRIDGGLVARSFGTNSKGGGRLHYEDVEMESIAINRPPCGIVVGDLNQTVKMGDYRSDQFANADKATPWVPFHFRVAECPAPSGLIARFTFGVKGDGASSHAQWFSLPGGPGGVAMQLGTSDFQNIAPGVPVSLSALGDGQRYTFHGRLRQIGSPVRGGRFSRNLRLMVEYL
ncbi:type 1 fimbrial protein [Luteibacter aegosomatis]|uniref:fimbrial protein n=1 Tax=Luteibacter aegosomatis TaxID=2911537 RepID=UPI001FFAC201|nr:fimbrial protein [Luteibacter aegosomatis]UPG85919.1 type 1 fimbrial protein [Luteibacter aegosomatis]